MKRLISVSLAAVVVMAVLAIGRNSTAQEVITTYYAPTVTTPVVTSGVTTAYYAPTTAYYTPTTAYYAPTTSYYAPTPVTSYYAPTTAYYAPTTAYYAPTTAYYAPTTLPTTLRPLPTIQLRRITPQPRHITGAVAITAVVITAATIAADCSALACSAGPVFVESTEGGIVAGGKRRGCRRSRPTFDRFGLGQGESLDIVRTFDAGEPLVPTSLCSLESSSRRYLYTGADRHSLAKGERGRVGRGGTGRVPKPIARRTTFWLF